MTPRRLVAVAALAIALSVVVGATYWSWSLPPLNVILVTFDTTRADHLGAYGYQGGLTSGFDDFAKRGVIFERAYAPAPITLPSHATMLTGLYPPEHGLRVNGEGRLPHSVPFLPQILKQRGYDTGAFISAFVLDSMFGLERGFDTYDDDLSKAIPSKQTGERRRDGQDVMSSALSWLRQRKSRPFFGWIHLYDAHGPYNKRPELYGDKFTENPYDAGIAAEVQQFERLLAFLKESKLDQKTLVVVTADHGEGLEDHLENEHAMLVYNTTLHVPLVFVNPRDFQPGRRVNDPVSLVDLMPTVLDILRIPIPQNITGRSLRLALEGGAMTLRPCYAEAVTPYELNRWCPLQAVISQRWKYIQTNRPEFYDLQNDPGELINLAESEADECQQMRNQLEVLQESFVRSDAIKIKLSEKDTAKLEGLGYAAGNKSAADSTRLATETLPDIKDMLPHLAKYEKARLLGLQGGYAEGIVLLQEVVKARNDYAGAFFLLGEFLYQVKHFDEATAAYRSVLLLRTDYLSARLSLGQSLAAQGHFEEAAVEFSEVIKQTPENASAHYFLADVLVILKHFDDAIVQYHKAIQITPDYVLAYVHLGQLFLKLERPKDAIPCFEQAFRFDPKNGVAVTKLLSILVQMGDTGKALKYAQKFAEIDPTSFEARYNLGQLLTTHKRYEEGISELREAQKLRPEDPRPLPQIQQAETALKRAGK